MSKATHRGTCQVCGRLQKLPNGRLSLHGYTTRCGFFEGVCTGAEALPFEQDISLIEGAIQRAKIHSESIKERQARLNEPVPEGTTKAWKNVYFPHKATRVLRGYEWVQVDCFRRAGNFYYDLPEGAFDSGEHNRRLAQHTYPRPVTMEDAILVENKAYAESFNRTLSEIAQYITWQEDRIKNWAPHPEKLQKIKEASK